MDLKALFRRQLWTLVIQLEGKGHGAGPFSPAPDSLVAMAGAVGWLVTVHTSPASLTVAHGSWGGIGLANAMQAVELAAGLTARHHAWLHLRLGKVL